MAVAATVHMCTMCNTLPSVTPDGRLCGECKKKHERILKENGFLKHTPYPKSSKAETKYSARHA